MTTKVAKVKYPVRAALALFTPIFNHLGNMWDYLGQAGHPEFSERFLAIREELVQLHQEISPFREK